MNTRYSLLLVFLLPLGACAKGDPEAKVPAAANAATVTAPAAAEPGKAIAPGDPRIALAAKIPGAKPENLRLTPVAGIYELTHGADVSYVSADAKFVFGGDMYQVDSKGDFPNLTEVRRRELRLAMLATVPESQMVVYGPQTAAHTITVFTDVDCAWCQRLHSQIADYGKAGIRVRYMAFPRSGPNTESWSKAESVWCAADRHDAITRAKRGEALPKAACPSTPIAREYQLGQEIGVTGTPGIILETGELVPGYVAAPQLLAHLEQGKTAANGGGAPAAMSN
jgi:thiol:disulfide interchange protein DsbC